MWERCYKQMTFRKRKRGRVFWRLMGLGRGVSGFNFEYCWCPWVVLEGVCWNIFLKKICEHFEDLYRRIFWTYSLACDSWKVLCHHFPSVGSEWPYKWVNVVTILLLRVIITFITGRAHFLKNEFHHFINKKIIIIHTKHTPSFGQKWWQQRLPGVTASNLLGPDVLRNLGVVPRKKTTTNNPAIFEMEAGVFLVHGPLNIHWSGHHFLDLLQMLGKVPNIISQMVVWWWCTILQSVKTRKKIKTKFWVGFSGKSLSCCILLNNICDFGRDVKGSKRYPCMEVHPTSTVNENGIEGQLPTQSIHAWNIHLPLPYYTIKNQPNVGKYTIHGCYGL